ncbi:hypothetical protein NB537_15750 [Vibrio parahaemolyticus]|nr:hypothetical protein [Vibrio parahaemolyticus]MCR9656236.1 hypothetical protein [Vibrio parahaemolyticus]
MAALPIYWEQVIIDTAQRLGFHIKGSHFTLRSSLRATFFIERDFGGLTIHRQGEAEPRYLMDELEGKETLSFLTLNN